MNTRTIQIVSRKDVPAISKAVIGPEKFISDTSYVKKEVFKGVPKDSIPQMSKEDIELAHQRSIASIRRMNAIDKRQRDERAKLEK